VDIADAVVVAQALPFKTMRSAYFAIVEGQPGGILLLVENIISFVERDIRLRESARWPTLASRLPATTRPDVILMDMQPAVLAASTPALKILAGDH